MRAHVARRMYYNDSCIHLEHIEIVDEEVELVLVRQLASPHHIARELIRVVMHNVPTTTTHTK